jgi:hypothetical protein
MAPFGLGEDGPWRRMAGNVFRGCLEAARVGDAMAIRRKYHGALASVILRTVRDCPDAGLACAARRFPKPLGREAANPGVERFDLGTLIAPRSWP